MGKKTRFAFGLVAVAITSALLLSGCMTINSETDIKADGSGSRTITLAVDPTMLGVIMQEGTPAEQGKEGPFGQITAAVNKTPGGKIQSYTDPASGRQGIEVSVPFKSLDDLKSQKLGSDGQSLDTIVVAKAGNVITMAITINTDQLSGAVSTAAGIGSGGALNPSDQAMASQLMSSTGVQIVYALAVPGKILDWQPKSNAGYDPATNKITWNVDGSTNSTPSLFIEWDNSKKPEPIQAPLTPPTPSGPAAPVAPVIPGAPSSGLLGAADNTGLETLQKYAQAQASGDQAAYKALFAGGKGLSHPLTHKYPKLFSAQDIKVTYSNLIANNQAGTAQWTAQWTVNDKPVTLTGVDVLTFDASGKITAIQSFVDPGQFLSLQGIQ